MKKLSLLLLACMAIFAFSSCSDDDDDADLIVGKWKYERYTYVVDVDNDIAKKAIEDDIKDNEEGDYTYMMEFFNNSTFKDSDDDGGKYYINDGKIALVWEEDELEEEEPTLFYYPFSVNKNSFSVTVDKTERYKDELVGMIENNGLNIDINSVKIKKVTVTQYYSKQ